ncbi:gluconolactonase [Frondihabitans sp. PAMC 28766]|uniref:SMP-30/gluconolactonase/LRE family protein n=1 Tax=Frondihabitans sp. PAMC 28766 TaxID=1795630 RepID=UPI00078E75FA|nr:SMP-30/gluconolactonase/LRE family protein [Frondihabitans sp. PAMC 28766]AMM22049.1 gluconolactonase [Frondihabitans sp. PAMC 28766]
MTRTALTTLGLLPEGASLEMLSQISTWAEGPVWLPDRQSLRWSDIKGDRILEWSWASRETTIYKSGVEFTNGRILDHDGSVLQCSHGRRRVERDRDGVVTPVVEQWQGHRFNSPNDIVVARDGAIWFTDPDYGITQPLEGHPGELEYGDHWVFRVARPAPGAASEAVPIVRDAVRPNGLAFSPDESVLYVVDSDGHERLIRAYDVAPGRGETAETPVATGCRVFATPRPGGPDGIRVDERGNVWSSCGGGVVVYSPQGDELGRIEVPEVTANLCFGGPDGTTLFVTATTGLYRIETLTRDAHLPR